MSEVIAKGAAAPVGAYPHARKVGNWIFLSGVGPRRPDTNEVPGNRYGDDGELLSYDIAAQCHSVLANIRAVLDAAGALWTDLVDVTVYLTDMKQDFKTFNSIYAEYFTQRRPCRTTIEVNALPTEIAIEMKCVACLGQEEN